MSIYSLTINDACKVSGLSRSTIYKQINLGNLTPRKCGKRTLILMEDLEDFLQNLPKAEVSI